MKTIHNRHLATLNDLVLQSEQAKTRQPRLKTNTVPEHCKGLNLGQRPQSGVEITVGVHPLELLDETVSAVRNIALRDFLQAVVSEREVTQALTTPVTHAGCAHGSRQRYQVQTLRRAAEMAGYWCAFGREERDVLYVATLIRGIQGLLAQYVVGPADLEDILFTLARSALHQLDDRAPRQATLLRLALGWGNADEVDAFYVPRQDYLHATLPEK